MQPINRKGVDLPVHIVHGVVVTDNPIGGLWVRFECMNSLSRRMKNFIHCGTPHPVKGAKDLGIYGICCNPDNSLDVMYAENKIIMPQWRRATLAYTYDENRSEVWAVLTVYNPDDKNIHDFTKRDGRWTAYRALRDLMIDSGDTHITPWKSYLRVAPDNIQQGWELTRLIREEWIEKPEVGSERIACIKTIHLVRDESGSTCRIRLPECNFVPKDDWAISIHAWVTEAIANSKDRGNDEK